VVAALGDNLAGLRIGVWGLAFKAGTDDMRESPAIPLIQGLLDRGARVSAHDPQAGAAARRLFENRIELVADPYGAIDGASALVIMTEWLQYRTPDFDRIRQLMARPLVIDGRNLWEPGRMRKAGFEYRGVGRGSR
jgi:UDPglucose 6-dehydrogenase